jgi:hypothetical protein
MLLKEMFSPIGGPKTDDQDIDWAGDLKFFIDSDDSLLQRVIFPAMQKHKKYVGHPKAYTLYLKPLEKCREVYTEKFNIENPGKVLPHDLLISMAKKMAVEQEKHIKTGDYED